MRLFIVGTEKAMDHQLVHAVLDGILVMDNREYEEGRRTFSEVRKPVLIMTAGRDTGVDLAVSNWYHWHRLDHPTTLATLEKWEDPLEQVITAFKLSPTHLLCFHPEEYSGDLSELDLLARNSADQHGIPTWTFRGGGTKE